MQAKTEHHSFHQFLKSKWGLLLILAAVAGVVFWWWKSIPASVPRGRVITHVPVIDAGHGGEDGGAPSISGVNESEINLEISAKTEWLMRFYGIRPVVVRREDISLHGPNANTLREKKREDLKARVKIVEDCPNAVLISIHQNTFSDAQYSGLQAFYSREYGSKELAEIIQNMTQTSLDTNNTRSVSKVSDNVYLMDNVTCPAVLVECGFLTNIAEEQLLRDDTYQTKLASVLLASFLQWETME